jgi:hypothetical protein
MGSGGSKNYVDADIYVKDRYEKQIKRFLRQYGTHIANDDPLASLLSWGAQQWNEKLQLEKDKRRLDRQLLEEQQANNKLKDDIVLLQASLQTAEQVQERQQQELTTVIEDWSSRLTLQQQQHDGLMIAKEQQHSDQLTAASNAHERNTKHMVRQHQAEVARLNQKITKLIGDIIVNQDDSKAWTDEKLKVRFLDLRRLVDNITSPHNLLIRQTISAAANQADRSFISREGLENYHFAVKGRLWAILVDHFFCTPLGFGALGPNIGKLALLDIYSSWRRLFDGENAASMFTFLENPPHPLNFGEY